MLINQGGVRPDLAEIQAESVKDIDSALQGVGFDVEAALAE